MATLQLISDFAGKTIGNWYVDEKIGEGGYGVVYRARHLTLDDRIAAIKLLKPEALHDPTQIERFRNEARAAARIRHPGIVRIDDIGEHAETGAQYIIMEYLRGMDLQRRLAPHREGLPLHEVLDYVVGVADVLDAVHAQGIIHRDIKPENVFLTLDGLIKLLDLGIAKLTPDLVGSFRTSAGLVLGSPGYFAPELADPKRNASIDHRSDVFSLAAVTYELITHARPWHFKDPWHYVALIQKADQHRPRDLRVLRPEAPAGWGRTIMAGLSKNPDDRTDSAGEFARALAADFPGGEQIAERRLDAIRVAGGAAPVSRARTSPAASPAPVEPVDERSERRSRTSVLDSPPRGASASSASPPAAPETAITPTLRETAAAASGPDDPSRIPTLTPERVPTLVAHVPITPGLASPVVAPPEGPDRVPTLVASPRVPTGSVPELVAEPGLAVLETGPTRTLVSAALDEARPAPIVASGIVATRARPAGDVDQGAVLLDPGLAAPARSAPIGTPRPISIRESGPTTLGGAVGVMRVAPTAQTRGRRGLVAAIVGVAVVVAAVVVLVVRPRGGDGATRPDESVAARSPDAAVVAAAFPLDAAPAPPPPDAAPQLAAFAVDAGAEPLAAPVDAAPVERHSRSTSRTSSAPRAPGTLIITASPFAEIEIDGRHRGTTPLTLDLPPKRYRVTLTGPAGEVKVFRVEVASGREKKLSHRWTQP